MSASFFWFVGCRCHTITLHTATRCSKFSAKAVLDKSFMLTTTRMASASPSRWSETRSASTDRHRKKSASWTTSARSIPTTQQTSSTCMNTSRSGTTCAWRLRFCRWTSMSWSRRTSSRASVSAWCASLLTRCSSVCCCCTIITSFTVTWNQRTYCSRRLAAVASRYTQTHRHTSEIYAHTRCPLKTSDLRIYWTDLHQFFSIGTYISRHHQSGLVLAIAQWMLPW